MGGQACILYGAAEFSRDVDLAVLADEQNLSRLQAALDELKADPVFLPPLSAQALQRGHACHFRSRLPGIDGLRIDVMSALHGCDPFDRLWARRRSVLVRSVGRFPVLSLPDLTLAKKTQRDKDWPMIRRLVEADYQRTARPTRGQIAFWLRELRTGSLLIELCQHHAPLARRLVTVRPLLRHAIRGDLARVDRALRAEEDRAREKDRRYWRPLRAELAEMRRALRK
jgi:hypothetical protein